MFLVNLEKIFAVVCMDFHEVVVSSRSDQIRYVRIISIIDGACTDYAEYVTIARPAGSGSMTSRT